MKTRTFRIASIVLCAGLLSCSNGKSELTIEGSYAGVADAECGLALRVVGSEKLVDSVTVTPEFRHVFEVEPERQQYFVQVSCSEGKSGRSPAFYFEPPRSGMKLQQIRVF